ncbi:MAG: hypothetical protein R3E10_15665 [Gemmatimonadota bacterium]
MKGLHALTTLVLAATLSQVYGAGLLVFAGNYDFHPTFGYVVLLLVIVQALWIGVSRKRHLGWPVGLALVSGIAAPFLVINGPQLGATLASLHPLFGVAVVIAEVVLWLRTRAQSPALCSAPPPGIEG